MRNSRSIHAVLQVLVAMLAVGALRAKDDQGEDAMFGGSVPRLQIEIDEPGMAILREYVQVVRQPRPKRIDVKATVRDGVHVYTNVAIHLKGSWSFQPIDAKPSLTLNFDKYADGQRFHGLTKIHLNNSLQDPSYLSEQLARELFAAVDVPSPRAGHALVKLNDRDLGLYVVIEGANKTFVKRNFKSAKGNLYDGGSGGDINKALKTDSGEQPEDRSDLAALAQAARVPDLTTRLTRLESLLDVERFINFVATENFIVHWDGYAISGNNYRVFNDKTRDKMIFMPSGMDQLFGVSRSPDLSLTPGFKGIVAKGLLAIPEARRRYLDRIAQFSKNEFSVESIHARVDRLASRLRPVFASKRWTLARFEGVVSELKGRIEQRSASVSRQLKKVEHPLALQDDVPQALTGWSFKPGPTRPALQVRSTFENREILGVVGQAQNSTGAWRTSVLLDPGRYVFSSRARTEGLTSDDARNTNGVLLRISGERSTVGITISDEWVPLSYEFDVRGREDVELVCEFRGSAKSSGWFEASSLRLTRKKAPMVGIKQARPEWNLQ